MYIKYRVKGSILSSRLVYANTKAHTIKFQEDLKTLKNDKEIEVLEVNLKK